MKFSEYATNHPENALSLDLAAEVFKVPLKVKIALAGIEMADEDHILLSEGGVAIPFSAASLIELSQVSIRTELIPAMEKQEDLIYSVLARQYRSEALAATDVVKFSTMESRSTRCEMAWRNLTLSNGAWLTSKNK